MNDCSTSKVPVTLRAQASDGYTVRIALLGPLRQDGTRATLAADGYASAKRSVSITADLATSGEHLVVIGSYGLAAETFYTLAASCTSTACTPARIDTLASPKDGALVGDSQRLIDVANSEQNPELRRRAVQHLGTMGRARTGDALVALYAKEKEADIKRTVINALFTQNNAESLVAIARKETDPAAKREIVSKLSLMTKSKVAMDYLMEILNK